MGRARIRIPVDGYLKCSYCGQLKPVAEFAISGKYYAYGCRLCARDRIFKHLFYKRLRKEGVVAAIHKIQEEERRINIQKDLLKQFIKETTP